jgi:hypothetical protein
LLATALSRADCAVNADPAMFITLKRLMIFLTDLERGFEAS